MPEETPQTPAPKAKPPALEDKPFGDFIEQDYVPSLKDALEQSGLGDLALSFGRRTLPQTQETCWQVRGQWAGGRRSFLLAFPEEKIGGLKAFACADGGAEPSYLEPFLSDERKITLPLLVFGVVQRLNGQKWLGWN
ncbi:DUF2996 domain-containing protein [Prochlorothrix hollandica]|uniref:DUF2996 domain-containing protein n=1 Tax=Prochlorothrix hollandica PCC 9006 = CALU 1027 TaxID=317619 RepID=A0A0M2PVI0_PROHO|nr:DUF2996 domain-containing protein [Prochlorothrix hollandica]KKJ00170.1 hypothetical protein PROH_10655 [Prochlorothrix hollandica PCC 9006 = CALU 1027]